MSVAFRPLERSDFPLLAGWLAEPLVARWWNHEHSPEAVERDFGAGVDGREPTEYLLALAPDDGQPFGLIQRYRIADYPEYLEELEPVLPVGAGSLSFDYLIGVPGRRGRGLGAAMIAACAENSWVRFPEATEVVVPVAAGNPASWRSLERAGFSRAATGELEPDNPRDPRTHFVYRLERARER